LCTLCIINAQVDTTRDGLGSISERLGVKTYPTFQFFKDGKKIGEDVIGYKKGPLADAVAKL
jgi:hypothetical protein